MALRFSKKIKKMIENIKKEHGLVDDNLEPLLVPLSLKTEATQETYLVFFNKWLRAGGKFDEHTFLKVLREVSDNSRATAYYALSFIYKSYGFEVPYKHSEVVPKSVRKHKEIMNPEEVIQMIEYWKNQKDNYKKGLLALSTIYGLRRIELFRLEKDDIDLENGKIFIFTAKGGEPREHIIPEKIMPILEKFKPKKLRRVTELNNIFDIMAYEADIDLRPRLGWHSIRRALITRLMHTDLNPNIIRDFLRWKGRGVDILQEYTLFNPEEVDRKVFEKHPFLEYWS